MDNANSGSVLFGVWSNSLNTTIAHPTIRDTYDNSIIFNAGAQSPHVYSVKLLNAGSQFIKSNPTWPDRSRQMGWTTAWSNILSSSTRLDHQRPIMALVLVIRMV